MADQTTAEQVAGKMTLGDAVAELIRAERERRLKTEIEKRGDFQPKNPYLSNISECDRQIVYGITNWKDRPAIDTELKARFEAGDVQEELIKRELSQLGFKVILAQERIEVFGNVAGKKVLLATGKIDGVIEYGGVAIPCEIKSMDPNIFRKIKDGREGASDFNKMPHLRKYLKQLKMYLHGKACEEGLFIITDCLGHWKIIPITWDAGECEAILQRLERVYPFWTKRELPDRIDYDDEICGKCPFSGICLPDIIREESEIVTDDEWLAKVAEHERLKPIVKQFNEIHDEIKDRFRRVKRAVAGDFVVFGKLVKKASYMVKESESWVTTVKRVDDIKNPKEG